jgi:glutamate racemase
MMTPSQPIGIFDSGIGGLTIAHAVAKCLPREQIIYFGDTAHLPYGEKPAAMIRAYSMKVAQMLLQQQCKLILIACHSASAAAYEFIKEQIAHRAIVMNVIDPVIPLLKEKYAFQRIGLIGTRQTVYSRIYKKKIDAAHAQIHLSAYATNLLASAIEEFGNHEVIDALLKVYLAHPDLQNIQALILACTHYPIIKHKIEQYYSASIDVIDASDIVAQAVKARLEKQQLLSTKAIRANCFYVSDDTASFAQNAKLFFDGDIRLEYYPLWDSLDELSPSVSCG